MENAQLINCIMQGYLLDVAYLVTKNIFKIVVLEPTSRGTTKPLAFLSLFTTLCIMQGVDISTHPKTKQRLPINKGYIQANYANELDNVQDPMPQSQPNARA